jgi:hypothetical protein
MGRRASTRSIDARSDWAEDDEETEEQRREREKDDEEVLKDTSAITWSGLKATRAYSMTKTTSTRSVM